MEFTSTSWDTDAYMNLYQDLHNTADETYRTFNAKIVKSDKPMIGVRMPVIKKCAKQIAKGNAIAFLKNMPSDYYESIMLKGLVIAYTKIPYEEFLKRTDAFLDDIENWAICDCFCGAVSLGKRSEDFFSYLEKYLESDNPWHIRVGLVMMLGKYLDNAHIDEVLSRCDAVTNPHYYVKMAQAWLVSTAFVKHPNKTLTYLKSCHLDDWTFNKSISKARESYRVSSEDKDLLNVMKRKIITSKVRPI
jgi:Predicted DNA alkylation repair enzyme